ncbi:Transcriptional regulator of ribosomal biogenesis proteins, partial [Dispira parvispora]
ECHVRLESDVSLDLLGFEDDWHSSSSSESDPSTHPSPYLKATQVPFMKHSSLYSNGTIMPFGQDELSLAAFDAAMLKAASTISSPTNPASPLTLNPSVTTNSAPVSDVETGLDTPVTSAPSTPKPKSRKRPASATSSGRASKKIATGGSRIRSLNSSAASSRASSDTEGGESVPSEQREKPYRCPVEGCGKAYKNPNGLKYHNLHGHCNTGADGDVTPRPHLCTYENCGKSYKNMNGLKYHIQHTHLPRPSTTPSTPMHTAVQS